MNTMNILNIIWVILTCVMFAIALQANISANQIKRQKYLIAYLGFTIILLVVFFVFARNDRLPIFLLPFFFAFGTTIPQLLAHFIKLRQIKTKVSLLQVRTSNPSPIVWLVGVLFMLFLTIMFLLPNRISLPDGKPIYDADYFYSRAGFLLYTIPAIILWSVRAFQKVNFFNDGLFHNSLSWEWSDFQVYSWRKNPKKKNSQELLLMTAKNVWTPSQIKLTVPNEGREQIDSFLSEKLKKASESA